jgi:hypothetical protein
VLAHHELAEPALLEPQRRRRVGEVENDAGKAEHEHDPAAGDDEHDQDRDVGEVDKYGGPEQPASADHPGQDRVRGVQRPRVLVGVESGIGVEEVVDEVVRDVRKHDPDERECEPSGREVCSAHGQQAGDRARGQCHRQHAGAGDDQPAGNAVKLTGRRVDRAERVTPARQPALRRQRCRGVGHHRGSYTPRPRANRSRSDVEIGPVRPSWIMKAAPGGESPRQEARCLST